MQYRNEYINQGSHNMRSTAVFAVFALSLLPVTALAQAPQQAAAQPGSTSASPAPSPSNGLTREQFIQRAEQRAARRAAAQFDRMDTDHDGVLQPAEIQAWRSEHPRGGVPRPDPSSPQ
jgi:hypothetical protein